MKMKTIVLAGLCAGVAVGCGSEEEPLPTELRFQTGDFEVPPGDSFTCIYTDTFIERELAVINAYGSQQLGGHHVTAYFTRATRSPTSHPCVAAEMADWNQVGGGGSTDEEFDLSLPEGLGIKIPAGVQMVLQAHYINLTEETFTANDDITLELADPATLESFVNQFIVIDTDFNVPAHEAADSVVTCTVPSEVKIVNLLGHLHEWGTKYTLERIDAAGEPLEILYEETWEPAFASAPPVRRFAKDAPLVLAAGTRLRQSCAWQNIEDEALRFPREMCLAYAQYFPDNGEIYCELD
ncbi:MAG TPA: hypothetical protein VML75_18825 [Kofleriaceae bacterium]|nr:hypothetical protein [Kofleriaceae bacterium]